MTLKDKIKKLPIAIPVYEFLLSLKKIPDYFTDKISFITKFRQFSSMDTDKRFQMRWKDHSSIMFEKTEKTEFDRHYIYHTAWAARCLAQTKPVKHVDISSSLFFSVISSAFVPIDFYDYRPADVILSDFSSRSADLVKLQFADNSIPSLSCMHTVEHIGLGRYGDALDPNGDLKAISELQRVLAVNGDLFFVVPVGKPRIIYNAHRIYSFDQIISYFDKLKLFKFTLIPEQFYEGGLMDNPTQEVLARQKYACGCFWFKKE